MANKITCTCGHSWNKSSSSKKDMRICHICGKDNTMKNGGWLDAYDEEMQLGGDVYSANYVPQAQNGIEGTMGGLTDIGFNYNGAWGGTMQEGGNVPQAQLGEILPASFPLGDLAIKAASKVANWFSSDKPKPTRRPSSSSEDDNETETLRQTINIKDPRKIRKTTGQPINPNVDLVSGEYDAYLIKEALHDAKNYGLSKEDAWNLAAIDFQETGWGKTDPNMGHVLGDQGGDTENRFLNAYLNKMKEADRLKITDPEMRLQVYNGLGFIKPETEQNYHKFKMKKIYGVPVPKEGLSMKKNPLYGKQIVDLRDNVLKQNPDITSYIESLYGEEDGVPKKAMGGNIPGSVGFTYARTKGIPSNGPYAKKTLASAQDGLSVDEQMAEASTNMWGYPIEPNFVEAYKKPTKKTTSKKTSTKSKSVKEETDEPDSFEEKKPSIDFRANRERPQMDALRPQTPMMLSRYNPYTGYIREGDSDPNKWNDDRSIFSDARAKERGEKLWDGTKKVTALTQFIPGPVGTTSKVLNTGMGLTDAYYSNREKDPLNTLINIAGAMPSGNKYISGIQALSDLTDNFGFEKKPEKKQNGGEMSFYQNGLDWTPRNISKNGSEITKDDNGYWNPENWGKPVEIGSNNITMKGLQEMGYDNPLLGISDTGDVQMMYPGEDYKFDGESVTEYPVAQDGETLLKNKKVGQLETPTGKLNLRPTYPNFKTKTETLIIPDCPDGAGCSKQATVEAQKITGLPYVAYAPADAAYRDAVAERTGLRNIFDQEGLQKTDADSKRGGWKYPTNEDFKNWRAGDIVTLDAGTDYYFKYNAPPGFSGADNHGMSHNGMVYGFTPEGRPIIRHGLAAGRDAGKSYTEILGEDNRVTDLGHGRYAVKSVWRPKEVTDDGTIKDIENVVDLGKDAAKRKQDTTSNEQFYLKNTDEERMMQENPVAGEFSGASNRLDTKKKLVNLFNDKKLNKDLQYKFGITAEELNNLKPVVYGIFGQESNFNDVDSPAASFKEILGNMLGGNSRGAAQIKLKSLTPEERKILGVKKSSDLDSDEAAYKAALLMVSNAKKRMDKEVAQGTHPELTNVDENFRAGYYYNSPGRAVNSAEEWARKSKPSQWYNPLSWKNALTTRERPDVFGSINPNYVNNAELRMDEGSYPYKLMENARDLGVGVDFEKGKDLEEVVVRGTTKPNTTFVKKKNGGWLDEL